jgi:hypothetical protein
MPVLSLATHHDAVTAANTAIRNYVRSHGTRPWGPDERAHLDRLRDRWLAALRNPTPGTRSRTA